MFGLDSISGGEGGLSGGSSESSASNTMDQTFGNISFGDNAEAKQMKMITTVVTVVVVGAVVLFALKAK